MAKLFDELKKEQESTQAAAAASQDTPQGGDPNPAQPASPEPKPSDAASGGGAPNPKGDKPAPSAQEPKPAGDPINEDLQSQAKSSVLKSIFGEDVNDVESAKSRYTELQSKVDQFQKLNSDYQEQLNSKLDPFASDQIREFNHWTKKTGIENYDVFATVKGISNESVESDPLGVIMAQRILEYPSYQKNKTALRQMVMNDLGFENEDDFREMNEVQKMKVQGEAHRAFKAIQDKQEVLKDVDTPKTLEDIQAEKAQKQEQFKKDWNPVIEAAIPGLKKFVIGDGEKPYSFEFDEQQVNNAKEFALNYLVSNGKEVNENNLKEALSISEKMLAMQNLPKIFSSHANHIRNMSQEEFDAIYDRPSAKDPKASEARKDDGVKDERSAIDRVLDFNKQRRQRAY